MGGDVTVRSELGKGSTFTIELPAEVKKPDKSPAPPPAVVANPVQQLQRPSATEIIRLAKINGQMPLVLVIDDDANVHKLVQRTLEPLGCRFQFASNGAEGYRLARELRPAVITLDVQMPVQDGWDTISQIKSDPDLTSTPVVMMTMSTTDQDLGFTFGAAEFLTKPVDAARLTRTLKVHLDGVANGFVLIVDDDPMIREVLRRQLENQNLGILEAENGLHALELLDRTRPNLIICDLMMPEMDGFKFLAEFRRHTEWAGIPVVVLSAMSPTPAEREFLSKHSELFLQKTDAAREELIQTVKRFLPKRAN
jgi:CheY-like chemotaxis protein